MKNFVNITEATDSLSIFKKLIEFSNKVNNIKQKSFLLKNKKDSEINVYRTHLHILDGQSAFLASEQKYYFDDSRKRLQTHWINVSFYIVDEKAFIDDNKEISIPVNSIVYQVKNKNSFKAYVFADMVKGRLVLKYHFINDNRKMYSVDVFKLNGKHYVYKTGSSYTGNYMLQVNIVDNSFKVEKISLDNKIIVETTELTSENRDSLDKYVNKQDIESKCFYIKTGKYKFNKERFLINIGGVESSAIFEDFCLKRLHPVLVGSIDSIRVGKDLYLKE